MLCQICEEKEATFHLKEIVKGVVRSFHVCEVCAKEKGLNESFFLPAFPLSNLIAGLSEFQSKPDEKETVICPRCKLTFSDIQKKGEIGCSSCYRTFADYLTPLLGRIHSKTSHSGKIPLRGKAKDIKERQICELRKNLEEAVKKEEYEKAAQFRDKIRHLEKKRIKANIKY